MEARAFGGAGSVGPGASGRVSVRAVCAVLGLALSACGDPATSGGAPGPHVDVPEARAATEPAPAELPVTTASPAHPGDGDVVDASPPAASGASAVTAAPLTALPIVEPTWPDHLEQIVVEAREEFAVPTVTVRGRAKLPPGLVVVDVRDTKESAVSVVPGARVLDTKAKRRAFVEEEHETPVLVYCTAGWRSAEFTRELRDAGVDAYNLEGGLCAWALYGQALVDAQGEPTRRIHGYSKDWADCVPAGYEAVW